MDFSQPSGKFGYGRMVVDYTRFGKCVNAIVRVGELSQHLFGVDDVVIGGIYELDHFLTLGEPAELLGFKPKFADMYEMAVWDESHRVTTVQYDSLRD